MFEFDRTAYGPTVASLLAEDRLCELGPGSPNLRVQATLRGLGATDLFTDVRNDEMARGCLAGLWIWHDFLNESHEISQNIGSSSGSYWHGIMHRRELDHSNAKYWFRRVGSHPIFPALQESLPPIAEGRNLSRAAGALIDDNTWQPSAFIDLGASAKTGSEDALFCREVARREWQLLFDYCYQRATM